MITLPETKIHHAHVSLEYHRRIQHWSEAHTVITPTLTTPVTLNVYRTDKTTSVVMWIEHKDYSYIGAARAMGRDRDRRAVIYACQSAGLTVNHIPSDNLIYDVLSAIVEQLDIPNYAIKTFRG